jgi:hypothetical protein
MERGASEITLTALLVGGPDDDAGSVVQGAAGVSRRWSAIGRLRPPPTVPAPEDTRGGEIAMLGAVTAAVLPLLPDLLAVLRSVTDWVGARPGRTAKMIREDGSSVELGGLSRADQHAMVQAWIAEGQRDTDSIEDV